MMCDNAGVTVLAECGGERGVASADDEDAADVGGDVWLDLRSNPIPSNAIVGGFPSIHAWIFHSAACAVLRIPLGTYFSHLYPPAQILVSACTGLTVETTHRPRHQRPTAPVSIARLLSVPGAYWRTP